MTPTQVSLIVLIFLHAAWVSCPELRKTRHSQPKTYIRISILSEVPAEEVSSRDLKIDNAASSKTRCQYISTGRSFLEFDCFNNHSKLVLVTHKYFCWPKRMLSAIS